MVDSINKESTDESKAIIRENLKPFNSLFDGDTVQLSSTITIPSKAYQALKETISKKFVECQPSTSIRRSRCDAVDVQLNSDNPNLSEEDRIATIQNREATNGTYKPLEANITIAPSQLDDALSDIVGILIPTSEMYQPFANKTNQEGAQAIATFMSRNARLFNHFEPLHLAISDALKYNWTGVLTEWTSTQYIKWINGQPIISTGREGSKLKRLDPRNTYCQPGIKLSEYSQKASFIGTVEISSVLDVNKIIWDKGLAIKPFTDSDTFTCTPNYNRLPMIFTNDSLNYSNSTINGFDQSQFGRTKEQPLDTNAIKHCWMQLVPTDYKLPRADSGLDYAIYHFILVNDEILFAEQVKHCYTGLPVSLSASILDGLESESRSFGEQLLPLQTFINYLYNIHRKASLKKIYGTLFYDASIMDAKELSANKDKVMMRVPVNLPSGHAIQSKLMSFNDAPDLTQTSNDMATALGLMQKILPTETAKLLGGLDRATIWQAMKTAREANKRTIKLARILDTNLMQSIIIQQVEACIAYLSTLPAITEGNQQVEIDMSKVDFDEIKYDISSGIQSIDKELTAQTLDTLINKIIQVPAFAEQFNVFELLDGLSSLFGTKIDFSQYKLQSPIDALPVGERNTAFELLQQAVAMAEQQKQDGEAQSTAPTF